MASTEMNAQALKDIKAQIELDENQTGELT